MGSVEAASRHGIARTPALSVLLSQVLVAFTVEFDNEFERQMCQASFFDARLSLVVWANVMRFVSKAGVSVRNLGAQALTPGKALKYELGCLERWGFVLLQPDPSDAGPAQSGAQRQSGHEQRAGWGSGRGIRAHWIVHLTSKGIRASEIWPPLFDQIERRWESRFGKDEIGRLRQTLQCVTDRLDLELPDGLPCTLDGTEEFLHRLKRGRGSLALPALVSQLLLTFRLEFDQESPVSLVHCANTLRVLGEKPTRVSEIPRLTGLSPETSDVGWQIKPYVVVTADPTAGRGNVVRLSTAGLRAQRAYRRLIGETEMRWEERFGKEAISMLRESLQGLFDRRSGGEPLLSEGLVPPQGTARAGNQAPALGRGDVGAAARQRMRDLVAQNDAFIRDPAGTLPHHPSWDMNRGFGP